MPVNSKISDFIERAKAAGGSEESIVGVLTARGWPEKEVYEVLAAHYERVTGIEIPRREAAATAAKDAFFYLLVFSTLATWTIGLGSLAFTLIDQWLPDTLFAPPYNNQAYETYSIAAALSSIIVAFPIFLLVSRAVIREGRSHPQKLNSPVRKWLTYMVLVIAAGVLIGDLIAALTYLLRGEITPRFLAKAFVILVLSGGVFYYYFGGLRKSEGQQTSGWLGRDARMAVVSGLCVIVMVILGFWAIGAPKNQRTLRADAKRVQDLYQVSGQIRIHWNSRAHTLPESVSQLPGVALVDPITRTPYDYQVKDGSRYELCATFSQPSQQKDATSRPSIWAHPAGYHCFTLNAAEEADNPYLYMPD
ncbi:MAG: DUF5671 domain-containing protein [Candidatus Acidiferrales bacterium]